MAFSDRAIDRIQRKKAGLHAFLQNWAAQLEEYAKGNASWHDQTAHARQGLHAGVEENGSEYILYLSHGMDYGSLLEMGTGIHGPRNATYMIRPKNKKALFWAGAEHPVREVIHPGMKARPIIRPTLDTYIPRIRRAVLDYWED